MLGAFRAAFSVFVEMIVSRSAAYRGRIGCTESRRFLVAVEHAAIDSFVPFARKCGSSHYIHLLITEGYYPGLPRRFEGKAAVSFHSFG